MGEASGSGGAERGCQASGRIASPRAQGNNKERALPSPTTRALSDRRRVAKGLNDACATSERLAATS
eukprot:13796321-Alexandrium_andersonii.AAC.1